MNFLIIETKHEGIKDSVVKHITSRFSHPVVITERELNDKTINYRIYVSPPLFEESEEELFVIKRDAEIIYNAFLDGMISGMRGETLNKEK